MGLVCEQLLHNDALHFRMYLRMPQRTPKGYNVLPCFVAIRLYVYIYKSLFISFLFCTYMYICHFLTQPLLWSFLYFFISYFLSFFSFFFSRQPSYFVGVCRVSCVSNKEWSALFCWNMIWKRGHYATGRHCLARDWGIGWLAGGVPLVAIWRKKILGLVGREERLSWWI